MAGLDLNELLNRSITNIVQEGKEGLDVDLEGAVDGDSDLALDLENVSEMIHFELPEGVMENLMGAIGAGIGTYAVLEARAEKRLVQ